MVPPGAPAGDETGFRRAGTAPLRGLDAGQRARLVERIDRAPLFAHAYSHHLNLRFGGATPFDLIDFCHTHRLTGLKIHVEDGEEHSLRAMDGATRRRFATAADGLRLHVETSATDRQALAEATAIAADIGAESIRCYPRIAGPVSQVIARTIADLRALAALDPARRFRYTLEQHEDLKAAELVAIVRAVGNERLTLLYDFGNMTNAFETPAAALSTMAPLVTEAHVKDVRVLPDRGGWAHLACRSGEGDIDIGFLLARLLLLGEEVPQVTAIALEEEDGMYAPAYRFPDEPDDPVLPPREASFTDMPDDETAEARLARERRDAAAQVDFIRATLAALRAEALAPDSGAHP